MFKTEKVLYNVKTEHISPQKGTNNQKKIYIEDMSAWLNNHHQNSLNNKRTTPKFFKKRQSYCTLKNGS